MKNQIENPISRGIKGLQCNIFQHSVESFGNMPVSQLSLDLPTAEERYLKSRQEKTPYFITMTNRINDSESKELSRIGFFTDIGLEVAAVIDENGQSVNLGTLPVYEDTIPNSSDLQVEIPFAAIDPDLTTGNRLRNKIKSLMDDLHSSMKRNPEFRFEIHSKLNEFRNDLMVPAKK